MNRISRIVARDILLGSSDCLWSEKEACTIRNTLMVDIPRAGNDEDLIDRDLTVKMLKCTEQLNDNASHAACWLVNKVPPAIFGITAGKPHEKPEPLTIEQVKAMDGAPVWIYNVVAGKSFWMLAYSDMCSNRLGYLDYRDYGKIWVAYGLPRTN